jgi:hypothetical protein
MAITPLPTPVPQRSDPTNFPVRADAFLTALPTFCVEVNAVQVDVNNKQTQAATSASNALTSETNAQASMLSAQAAANSSVWVSGTTYAAGDTRFSPTDFRTYRRRTAGAGSTDPTTDPTNWQLVSNGPPGYMLVKAERASGVAGAAIKNSGDPAGFFQRQLTTVASNTIAGASFATNRVTLPAGTYDIEFVGITSTSTLVIGSASYLYNVTDASYPLTGEAASYPSNSYNIQNGFKGRLIVTSAKVFEVRQYMPSGSYTASEGFPVSSGLAEVYASLHIYKVG